MIDMPPEIRMDAIIKVGAVLYFTDDALKSTEPHYFVLCNAPTNKKKVLLMVVGSSQIEKRKRYVRMRNLPKETLIQIPNGTLGCFTKDTIFNCNDVFERTREDLVEKLENGTLKLKTTKRISSDVMSQIIGGILASPTVEDAIKQRFRTNCL